MGVVTGEDEDGDGGIEVLPDSRDGRELLAQLVDDLLVGLDVLSV